MPKVPTGIATSKAKKAVMKLAKKSVLDTTAVPMAKVNKVYGQMEDMLEDANELRAAADGMRAEYPLILEEKIGELLGYLRMADGYAKVLGTDFPPSDDDRFIWPPPDQIQLLNRAGRFIWDKEDALPDWLLRDVREDAQDALKAWRAFSNAAYTALEAGLGIPKGIVALYDATTWTVDSLEGLLTKTPRTAVGELCRDYIPHSGYRRYKLDRDPGRHAKWNQVCDFWAENDTEPFGESFYWPRPEDPDPRGLYGPPTSVRAGKSLVEEGCLPHEICQNDPYRHGYHIDYFGMRGVISGVLDVPDRIERVIDGREMDDLLDAIDGLLDAARPLLVNLRGKVSALEDQVTKPWLRATILAIEWLWGVISLIPETLSLAHKEALMEEYDAKDWGEVPWWRKRLPTTFRIEDYHLEAAVASDWNAEESIDAMITGLRDTKRDLRDAIDKVDELKAEVPTYRGYWAGTVSGHPSYGWRDRIAPYIDTGKRRAEDIDAIVNGTIWTNLCADIYPTDTASYDRRAEYWIAQGVPERCISPTGSYEPTPRWSPPTQERPGGQRGPFAPGGKITAPITAFGSVAPPKQGLQTWQKLALAGVAFWLVTRSK